MEFLIFNFFFIVELLYKKLQAITHRNDPHNANCDSLNKKICK